MNVQNILFSIGLVFIISLSISCDKEDDVQILPVPNTTLCQALLDKDLNIIEIEINKLAADLLPSSTDPNHVELEANFDMLVKRVDDIECLTATKLCYGCVETFPLISEMEVTVELNDTTAVEVLDIYSPDDGSAMTFAGMH